MSKELLNTSLTEVEKEKILLEVAIEEQEEFKKLHQMKCPKCGGNATDYEIDRCNEIDKLNFWSCDLCDWSIEK